MFSAHWLSLREPADAAARSDMLTRALADALPRGEPIQILDLASGTGANARYLLDRLQHEQRWLLADHDPALLAAVPAQMTGWAESRGITVSRDGGAISLSRAEGNCRIVTRSVDLSQLVDVDLVDLFEGRHLVTASALLDLVSDSWLRRLAGECRRVGAVALFALTYDGRIECDPQDPDDAMIRELVNLHQHTDKGFGPALGPDAADAAERSFATAGFQVRRAASDWTLSPSARELQRQLIDGWASAAREIDKGFSNAIDQWRSRRVALVDRMASSIIVGHEDMLACRPD